MSDTPIATPAPEAPQQQNDGAAGETVTPAPETAAPKKKAPNFRKFKDGDEEFALSDEDIVRERKKWKGADAKFREAAEMRKQVESFQKAFNETPEEVLNNPKIPAAVKKKLAEKWLIEHLDQEINPPDPRDAQLTEAQKKLKAYEEKEAADKAAAEEAEKATVREQRKAKLSETLSKAMAATHLSAHPETAAAVLREMAMYTRACRERDIEVTPDELVAHLHNAKFNQMYTLAHQFEGDELIEFLGDEIVQRIRKADLARLRAGRDKGDSHRTEVDPTTRERRNKAPKMDAYTAARHAAKVLGR